MSSGTPKVKRICPVCVSAPTVPSRRPIRIIPSALINEPCASAIAATSPSTIRENFSIGPGASANSDSGCANASQDQRADAAGEEGTERGDGQRGPGAALARHLIAVETRHHRRRLAGEVHQDGGGRAAVLRAVVDSGEQDQGGHRRQREGRGQQHGYGGNRADSRQHSDQRAERHAEQAVEQILQCKRDAEAQREVVQEVHGASSFQPGSAVQPSAGQTLKGSFSPYTKMPRMRRSEPRPGSTAPPTWVAGWPGSPQSRPAGWLARAPMSQCTPRTTLLRR